VFDPPFNVRPTTQARCRVAPLHSVPGTVILVLYRPWALDHSHSPEATRPVPRTMKIHVPYVVTRAGVVLARSFARSLARSSLSFVCFTHYCPCLRSEPPARIYTPPMVPGGLAAAVARRTSDIEGTPTPLRVGVGMSTPPRRALGSRREYSENDLP
jgi:hypothetical protein